MDWQQIANELGGLMPGVPESEKRLSPDHDVAQVIPADEGALLAHIADALAKAGVDTE
jgi:hypothetical protein